jgi:hypothetical protein
MLLQPDEDRSTEERDPDQCEARRLIGPGEARVEPISGNDVDPKYTGQQHKQGAACKERQSIEYCN